MNKLRSGVILTEGEVVVAELEAELWATSGDPISRLIGSIYRFIAWLLGHRRKGYLVITNKRVVEVTAITTCYVFTTDKVVKYILPSSVREVGYTKESTCGVFCPAYHLYYEAQTQRTSILLKTGDEAEAQRLVDAFYSAIA
jgi:hypothetical protein